jgi:hypothetical protein
MDNIAESYVKLVLAVGRHDPDYVDAYYGEETWMREAQSGKKSLEEIRSNAAVLIDDLHRLDRSSFGEMERLRHQYLLRQLESLVSRVDILSGVHMSFDDESRALYDAVAPHHPESHFQKILNDLEALLPGKTPLPDRYEAFRKDFVISREKLDAVFTAAVEEGRKRTRKHIQLPKEESFSIEYVTGKSWSGYNWYKGNSHSLIQVNTDLPIYIDRAVDLGCHEGYPGHHVYNTLLEAELYRKRGWVEFSVYALFSPQSLIAEGTANFGIEVTFSRQERIAFERDVLFPLAGLDPGKVDMYYQAQDLAGKLAYAGNESARRYLNGEIERDEAARWLTTYALMSMDRAQQRVRFFDQYRSYVINYNLGKDLVQGYIESRGGTDDRPQKRWEEFKSLISSPRLPSGLT